LTFPGFRDTAFKTAIISARGEFMNGEKVHTRNIEITTYPFDEERVIVEGCLKDERYQETYVPTGEKFPPGVIHHLRVKLWINVTNMQIQEVKVELLHVPREFCREASSCLDQIKGLYVTRGFTRRVKELAGGVKGCAHLVELLLAMAPAIFQGVAAMRARKPSIYNAKTLQLVYDRLVNTCHVWRQDGPLVKALKERFSIK